MVLLALWEGSQFAMCKEEEKMINVNIKVNDDGMLIFDPEYFIEGERYVVPSDGDIEEMKLRKYERYGLIFENDKQIYGLSIEKYANDIMFTENNYSLYSSLKKLTNEKMIYRIGNEIGILTEEKQIFSNKIQQDGLVFLMNNKNEIRILSNKTRTDEEVLLNRLGGLDVSVLMYNTEEFLDRVKMVKKIVYENDDFTFKNIDKESLIRKTPTFDNFFKDKPLLIFCKSGNGYVKLPSDHMGPTHVVARDKKNFHFICDVEKDFVKAVELVVPTNEIRSLKELLDKIGGVASVHCSTSKGEMK